MRGIRTCPGVCGLVEGRNVHVPAFRSSVQAFSQLGARHNRTTDKLQDGLVLLQQRPCSAIATVDKFAREPFCLSGRSIAAVPGEYGWRRQSVSEDTTVFGEDPDCV